MAIKLGGVNDPADFGDIPKSEYVKKYTVIIVQNKNELEPFNLYDIPREFGFNRPDYLRFKELIPEIKKLMLSLNLAESVGWQIQLVIGAKEKIKPKPKKEKKPKKVLNIEGNNYGQIVQDSLLENSPNIPHITKVTPDPIKKEPISIWRKIWKFTDHKVIADIIKVLIGAGLTYLGLKFF